MRVKIIGIGSSHGDDQIGWRVVESLAGCQHVEGYGGQVSVTACRSPGGELTSLLKGSDIAILIDGVVNGGAPGTMYRISNFRSFPRSTTGLSSHGMGVQAMLELADRLGDLPETLILYGVEVNSSAPGEPIGDYLGQAVGRVSEAIALDIRYYCV